MHYVADAVLNLDGEFVKAEPFTQCRKYSHIGPHHDPRDWAMQWQRQGNAAVVPMVECGHGCGFHANIALMSWHEPENERK